MAKLTPMMQQYLSLKKEHQDAILLFRLGDFYEAFFEDAEIVSRELQIVLTRRHDAPMAGIPHHALDNYLKKLVEAGYKVAICDQVEDPAQAKGLVRREVTRIVTPGTIVEDALLGEENNFTLFILPKDEKIYFSLCDVSTGEFYVGSVNSQDLDDLLGSGDVREILLPLNEHQRGREIKRRFPGIYVDYLEDWFYDEKRAEEDVKDHYGFVTLEPLELSHEEITAAAAMLRYLKFMHKRELNYLEVPTSLVKRETMFLDASTVENLELTDSSAGKQRSFYHTLKSTRTGMGARLLKSWILAPSLRKEEVEERLGIVQCFVEDPPLLAELREYLGRVYDIERIISRLSLNKATPGDLVNLRATLRVVPLIVQTLSVREKLEKLVRDVETFEELKELLEKGLAEEVEGLPGGGGVIREGYSEELDEARQLLQGGEKILREFEVKERMKTGITGLKVGYNKVYGYYIEIPKSQARRVPRHYERRQTLVNAERFITPELKEYEDKVLHAQEKVEKLEREIFNEICERVKEHIPALKRLARWIARVDVLSSFADNALKYNYVKPSFSEDGSLILKGSRHPVVERYVDEFIPNDIEMNRKERFVILTGPNMSGKSTFLRQVALIALMAQMGSFVPAEKAVLPMFDRIFTRIGARDDVVSGKSTFLVEMMEVATIIRHATERSLVLLDEVGRGTSTFDGISIAWAVSEYLHNVVKPFVIFATHFTELTELARMYKGIVNKTVLVEETSKGVVFLHRVVDGVSDRSYGVEVAKLAGIPRDVVERAREVLEIIESKAELDRRLRILSDREIKRIASTRKKHFVSNQLKLFEEEGKGDAG